MEKQENVNYKGLEELEYAVRNLGMQRVLYELASIINSGSDVWNGRAGEILHARQRYSTQFAHDLHHTTAGDRNERTEQFKMDAR